jgi:hypothetical protein
MSSYRFCRTDDIGLLVDALNRCWAPHCPGEPLTTAESFKRSIRDLQVWCSSCMVAFAGSDPIAVLIGAKRPSATLIHRIAVHPDHLRQGHARPMVASLGSKLARLGPPRIVAEVPAARRPACGLFTAAGYVEEATLTDYVLAPEENGRPEPGEYEGLLIPVTIDDLAANGLLEDMPRHTCWERSHETLSARKDEVEGMATASDESIEAYVLYDRSGAIVALRSLVDDGGARLRALLGRVRERGIEKLHVRKVHPDEASNASLEALGFRAAAAHLRYAGTARSG